MFKCAFQINAKVDEMNATVVAIRAQNWLNRAIAKSSIFGPNRKAYKPRPRFASWKRQVITVCNRSSAITKWNSASAQTDVEVKVRTTWVQSSDGRIRTSQMDFPRKACSYSAVAILTLEQLAHEYVCAVIVYSCALYRWIAARHLQTRSIYDRLICAIRMCNRIFFVDLPMCVAEVVVSGGRRVLRGGREWCQGQVRDLRPAAIVLRPLSIER